jgi:hypothetical protein
VARAATLCGTGAGAAPYRGAVAALFMFSITALLYCTHVLLRATHSARCTPP